MRKLTIKCPPEMTICLFLFITGLGLFLPFLSTNYDINSINEAAAIEQGGGALFSPNHMLYRPLVWIAYELLKNSGVRAIQVGQVITALIGALGLGLFYILLHTLIGSNILALLITLGMGTSWSYWTSSTDVHYIGAAATCVIVVLILSRTIRNSSYLSRRMLLCQAGIMALAILFWQTNIFLIPITLIILYNHFMISLRDFLTAILLWFVVPVGLLVGSVYLLVGFLVVGLTNLSEFLNWVLRYGAQISMWGRTDAARLGDLAKSIIASLIPLVEGLGFNDLLHGKLIFHKNFGILALFSTLFLIVLPALIHWRANSFDAGKKFLLAWMLLIYLSYLPFIFWWDPNEPKWLVVPNIALWALIAILWHPLIQRSGYTLVLGILIFIIAMVNFTATVWPRHSRMNLDIVKADCVARNLTDKDVLISAEWTKWDVYVGYFYHRQVISLIDLCARYNGVEPAFGHLYQEAATIHARRGKIYSVDFDSYFSSKDLQWLADQTDLTESDLQRFENKPAFKCEGIYFQEITNIR